MGYCYHNKQKDYPVYTKVHNNTVPEVPEPKKRIKQDYESVKNQIMESNTKTVDIQKGTNLYPKIARSKEESNKTKKYTIN